jgi:Rrf2 family protein
MRLSTRTRYGTRLLFELAYNYGSGPILLKDIAKRQDISEKYLSKIIILLRTAGIVTSFRGAKGGYALTKAPSETKMREIIEALEGDVSFIDCTKDAKACPRIERCPTREFWCGMENAMNNYLESETLDTIVENYKRKTGEAGEVYYI